MAANLTPQQHEAVTFDGHLLIVAGPGSGKTSTSVAKAKRILNDPARSLVMVTFTKEAAEEMRKRLATALTKAGARIPNEERLIVATFHSIAIQHLSRHRPRFKVLSPAAQSMLFRDALMAAHVEKDKRADVQKDFERFMYAVDRNAGVSSPECQQVVERYMRLVQDSGQVDLYTVMRDCALQVDAGTIPPLPHTDILVDEGQDTDDLQRLWIFAHARAGRRVTIVGDDDQSVYEWRNALGYEGMRSFLETFNARRIELGDNFRSRSEILDRAAKLIACNKKRLGKNLVARRGPGGAITAFRASSSEDQNFSLADVIEAAAESHRNGAVLARTNLSLDMLEIVLRGRGLPYLRLGRSIWHQPVIAGYVGLLQSILDGTPAGLLPVLQLRKVSDDARADLLTQLRGNASTFLDGEVPVLDSADASDTAVLKALAKDCSYWRKQLRGTRLGGSVREVILEVGEQYARWNKGGTKKSLLELCSKILADLNGTLSARLRVISRKDRDLSKAPIVLMTMHGAKGLEFETVHIVDANHDDDGIDALKPEAERRLMYVAMTRAKNCCVTWYFGEPHPTLAEAQLPTARTKADLVALISAAR